MGVDFMGMQWGWGCNQWGWGGNGVKADGDGVGTEKFLWGWG